MTYDATTYRTQTFKTAQTTTVRNSTSLTELVADDVAGVLVSVTVSNANAAAKAVTFKDAAGTVLAVVTCAPTSSMEVDLHIPAPDGLSVTNGHADLDTVVTWKLQ